MSNKKRDYSSIRQRQNRYFSESFKQAKVKEIEKNLTSVREICKEYSVSHTAVYKWLYKYSQHRARGVKQVIEMESDTKKIKALKEKVQDLEQLVGQKQIQLEFYEKMLELASEQVGFDLKKKYGSQASCGTGNNKTN